MVWFSVLWRWRLASVRPREGLLCHSDRGSQYASHDYQKRLQDAGMVCSMSRKGNCWDNAPTESFFATLKKELVHRVHFATRGTAHRALFAGQRSGTIGSEGIRRWAT